jgi:hypothetical protein
VKEDKKKTKKDRYKDKKPTKPGELVQIDINHEYVNGRKQESPLLLHMTG